jgi:hypothetical protein
MDSYVASDYRYQYWAIIAIFVAALIHVADRRTCFIPLTRVGMKFIAILAVALIVIQYWQTAERNALFVPGAIIDERTKQEVAPP